MLSLTSKYQLRAIIRNNRDSLRVVNRLKHKGVFWHDGNMSIQVGSFFLGLTSGTLGSLVGMGGAFVALPFLTGSLGLSQHLAHGTSIAGALATSLGGCISYSAKSNNPISSKESEHPEGSFLKLLSQGHVDFVAALCLASSSTISVIYGAKLSKKLSPIILKRSLGMFMILIAPMIPAREALKAYAQRKTTTSSSSVSLGENIKMDEFFKVVKLVVIGAGSGLLAGIFGVGGGTVVVPALCFATDLEYHTVLGTSLAAMIPTTISGCIMHFHQGTMSVRIAVPLAIGSFIGSYVGGKFAKDVDDVPLKYLLAVLMFVLGGRTFRLSYSTIVK